MPTRIIVYELIAQVIQDPTTQIDHGLIRTLNSIILRGIPGEERNRGRYRPGPSLIVDHRDHDIIRYRPSEPEYVNDLMDGLIADIRRWLEEDVYPPPVVAALAHFGIISIHPFDEGNGRTARLLADIILNQYGWSAEGMVSVSQAIMRDREAYYEALRETQGEEFAGELDVCPFVTYHTTTLDDAASKLEDTAINFRKMVEGFQGRVGGALNRRQPLGVLYMATIGPISTSNYSRVTETSGSSAFNDLQKLVKFGLAERVGSGRKTRYRFSSDMANPLQVE